MTVPDVTPEQPPGRHRPNDPLLAYLQSATGAVDIDTLELDSPALEELSTPGVKLAVPLVSQGELIGVLNLGPRLSEQEYSSDDRKLLDNLAAQAAPALRAAAQRLMDPGEVLKRVNEHLCRDMPEKMFVTCLYGVLDPNSGLLRFANARHDLPYVKTANGVVELRARGMPLGLLPCALGLDAGHDHGVRGPGRTLRAGLP